MKRILVLAANPKDSSRLRLDEEVRDIEESLRRSIDRDQLSLKSAWAVRSRDIQRALLDYKPHIVHFSGHGTGQQGLVFEDNTGCSQLITGEAISSLFSLFKGTLECVLLNGCYSEFQAKSIFEHIDFVIGTNDSIPDRVAIDFAVGFYDALGAGETYNFAYKLGCAAAQFSGISDIPIVFFERKGNSLGDSLSNTETSSNKECFHGNNPTPREIFISYADADERWKDEIETHLTSLKREGKVIFWSKADIGIGSDWAKETEFKLATCNIFLLLISANFLASDFCYSQLEYILERNEAENVVVVPVIISPSDWEYTPLKSIEPLPSKGKPITEWINKSEALNSIAQGIRKLLKDS